MLSTTTSRLLVAMFDAMLARLGPSGWWPAQGPFEVAVGAILTQNTNWSNVEKAIANLRRAGLLTAESLRRARPEEVEKNIQPSGFFRQKTKKIFHFLEFLEREGARDVTDLINNDTSQLRKQLLNVNGIGPETADSILLYALNRPVFVVDAYTARIAHRHGLVPEDVSYPELQEVFMSHLAPQVDFFNEYHALLVRVGKKWCRKRLPLCNECPLRPFLREAI
ncbi:MAG: endonuclease III domain-containing protein [Desulfovibrionales bacterium]|nr:MAG: endonuclease III domain-containing protein [Desulfovibrionales bacterium]